MHQVNTLIIFTVRNWTSGEVADWLVTAVELQELVDQVMRFNIIGRMLPM